MRESIERLFQYSLLVIVLPTFALSTNQMNRFPAATFFNVPQGEISTYFQYLCTEDVNGKKDCSCSVDERYGNWCIDLLWNISSTQRLHSYLQVLRVLYKQRVQKDNQANCQPVLPHLQKSHVSDNIRMITSISKANNTFYDCLGKQERTDNASVNLPVWDSENKVIYRNQICAEENGVMSNTPIEVTTFCDKAPNFKQGMLFHSHHLKLITNCTFRANISIYSNKLPSFYNCLETNDPCFDNNIYHDLCQIYHAPINGSKNRHCKLCTEKEMSLNEKPKAIFLSFRRQPKPPVTFSLKEDSKGVYVNQFARSFPAELFYEVPKADINSDIQSLLCNSRRQKGCCECDKHCMKFKTCCPDFLWNTTNPLDINNYKKKLIQAASPFKEHSCEKLIPHAHNPYSSMYLMVSQCAHGVKEELKRKCLDVNEAVIQSYIPVVGNDSYLYRNMFCAECNFVLSYKQVRIYSTCRKKRRSQNPKNNCILRLEKDNEKYIFRVCQSPNTWNRNCNRGNKYYDLCKSFKASSHFYANYFCFLCDKGITQDIDIIRKNSVIGFCFRIRDDIPWSVLISFNKKSLIEKLTPRLGEQIQEMCDVRTIFSAEAFDCTPVDNVVPTQVPTHLPTHVPTERIRSEQPSPTNKITVENQQRNNDFERCVSNLNRTFLYMINYVKNNSLSVNLLQILNISSLDLITIEENSHGVVSFINIDMTFERTKEIMKSINMLQIKNISLLFYLPYERYASLDKIGPKKILYSHLKCRSEHHIVLKEFNFTSNCDIQTENDTYDYSNIFMRLSLSPRGIQQFATVCRDFTVEALVPEHSLISTIGVIEVYISYIGSSISCLSYIMIIITFRAFQKLRNVPGQLIVGLSSTLLCSDVIFLFVGVLNATGYNRVFELCKTVAICLHFALTMTHIWNFLLSIDMMIRFTMILSSRREKTFEEFCIISFFVTSGIVAAAVILDELNIVLIGYGEDGICVPHRFYGRLLFYVTPAVIAFIISFLIMIRVVYKLSKNDQENNETFKDSNRKNRNVALLALKLTLILGLSEGIGYLQIVNNTLSHEESLFNAIVGISYTVCRSLRGLMLMCVYIFRKDIYHLYVAQKPTSKR